MKHVGLNVAADPLFTAAYTGVNGGLVIIVADDPGMHSSQNEQDSRCYAKAAHVPMLEPSDSMEAKDFMRFAYDISEKFDTPVLVRSSTRVSHSRGLVKVMDRKDVPLKEYKKDIRKYVMMPGMARVRHVEVEKRETGMESFAETFALNRVEMADTKTGVITSGIPYTYVKEALPDASVLKLGMVHPLPKKLIADFAKKVDKLYIIEELEPFFEEQILAMGISCEGKALFTRQGEYSANMLREKILGVKAEFNQTEDLPQRPPVLCAGCPHRGGVLHHQQAEAQCDGGHRLLHAGRAASPFRHGRGGVHGGVHWHDNGHGKGARERRRTAYGGGDRGFDIHTFGDRPFD